MSSVRRPSVVCLVVARRHAYRARVTVTIALLCLVAGAAVATAVVVSRTAAQRERVLADRAERAERRVAECEAMLDQVRAERHHIAPPVRADAAATVALPEEMVDELDAIEDPEARAEYRQHAEHLLGLSPAMRTADLVAATFGLDHAGQAESMP